MEPIILYDAPSQRSYKAWSPNTWKIRYALNYKGIAYRTEWTEYPDIEPLCKRLGIPPTDKKPNGGDRYTLPIIYDPSTNTAVGDSAKIAKYLDTAYPRTPRIFPPGTDAFQAAFEAFFLSKILQPTFRTVAAQTAAKTLNPISGEFFRRSREEDFYFGKLENLNTPEAWKALEEGLGQAKIFLEANGEGKALTFFGNKDKLTFSDFQLAAVLKWSKSAWGDNSEEWERIARFHDGFPGKFLEQFNELEVVDL
ncbi:glutathione transferase GTE1 [Irpex rosettiformis]|uniref:Glutathione transferase GTE1 n=1 Tax=Irpex rosettiformis TaxID=378272 RepID=A0ACB8U5X4_9APHY|nr:glutathione transferase GTE1 [Irpex rosettiformis]